MRWPPSWSLVLFGLILNVLAILMSSVVLENLGREIDQLEEQKSENIYAIQLAWNRVETIERKHEVLMITLAQGTIPSQLSIAIQEQLSGWVDGMPPTLTIDNLPEINRKIEQSQQSHRDQIDSFYLENIAISELMAELDHRISWYKSIGLFLQIFGLALILARDLARK